MTRTVVYFTDTSAFGGAEQALLTLMHEVSSLGWQPVLVHHAGEGVEPLVMGARNMGARTLAVPRMRGRGGPGLLPAFVRLLRAEHAEVFHAHLTQPLACTYGRFGAVIARVPAIVETVHLFIPVPFRLPILAERALSSGINRYIAVSEEMARQLRQVFGFPASKIEVIHNGIPLAMFTASKQASRLPCPGMPSPPVILTTARLHEQKGHRYLLEAAALVPEASFLFAGDGPELAALQQQARALGIEHRAVFLGHVADVAGALAGCDLFVLPSLYEGFPLSVLEAMAAARPVIATDVGGTAEVVVHGETGLLVPPADPHALATAIRTLLADPALAGRLAHAGQAAVSTRFSAGRMARDTVRVYEQILGSYGGQSDRRSSAA